MAFMTEKRTIRSNGHKRHLNWFLITLAVIIVFSGWTLINQQSTLSALKEDTATAQARLKAAQEENQLLKAESEQLSDEAYVEKLAREDLGMTRQGELPYIYDDKK